MRVSGQLSSLTSAVLGRTGIQLQEPVVRKDFRHDYRKILSPQDIYIPIQDTQPWKRCSKSDAKFKKNGHK